MYVVLHACAHTHDVSFDCVLMNIKDADARQSAERYENVMCERASELSA